MNSDRKCTLEMSISLKLLLNQFAHTLGPDDIALGFSLTLNIGVRPAFTAFDIVRFNGPGFWSHVNHAIFYKC